LFNLKFRTYRAPKNRRNARTSDEAVSCAESASGIFRVGRVEDEQKARIRGDERAGQRLAAERVIGIRRRDVLASHVGTQVSVAAADAHRHEGCWETERAEGVQGLLKSFTSMLDLPDFFNAT